MGEVLAPWQDLTTLKERAERIVLATGTHRRNFDVHNLRPDCRFNCQDCRTHDTFSQVLQLLDEALTMVRYYRTRTHLPAEDEEGTLSKYHRVYGIHYDAMVRTDSILKAAKMNGWNRGAVTEWH